jgi:very-short-patch-repair endonuclease
MKRLALRPDAIAHARRLRQDMTPQERKLWHALRESFAAHNLRRQVPLGPYFADFTCHRARLVIEVDGSQHGSDAGIAYDEARTRFLEAEGYRVLRFWNGDIDRNLDGVLRTIGAALVGDAEDSPGAQTRAAPASRPPHKGEEAIGQSVIGVS